VNNPAINKQQPEEIVDNIRNYLDDESDDDNEDFRSKLPLFTSENSEALTNADVEKILSGIMEEEKTFENTNPFINLLNALNEKGKDLKKEMELKKSEVEKLKKQIGPVSNNETKGAIFSCIIIIFF
jgi:hypothetical protein